jgi:polar amino acid transport system substrate-binding protein
VAQRTDCLVALQQGAADAISTDDAILLGFKAQDPYTKIIGPRFSDEPYGIAISKSHPEFVRFVNGVLERMRADGTWRGIYARWLGRYYRTPAPPAPHYLR